MRIQQPISSDFSTVLTLTSWIISTIASVFAAKYACDAYDVDAVVLSMLQFFVASTLLQAQSLYYDTPFRRPSHKHLLWLLVVSVGVFLRETLKFAAVANIGINLFNALKSLGPVVLVILDGCIYRIWPKRSTLLPFSMLVVGGLVMGLGTRPSAGTVASMMVVGGICGLLSTLVECGATIGQKWVLAEARDLDDSSVQYYLSTFSLLFSFISFLDTTSHHGTQLPSVSVRPDSSVPGLIFVLLASSGLAFLSTLLAIKSLRKVSAAKYTILDTLRRLLSSVLAVFLFGESMNFVAAIGLAVSIFGIYLYGRAANDPASNSKSTKQSRRHQVSYRATDDVFSEIEQSVPSKKSTERIVQVYNDQVERSGIDEQWKEVGTLHHQEDKVIDAQRHYEYMPIVQTNYKLKRSETPTSIAELV